MPEKFIVVWRESEGAALQTYALSNKAPRVFADPNAPEAARAVSVDEDEFLVLLAGRAPFDARRVSAPIAQRLLGWTV